jgi:F-type H+-transporting ATPase subunit a
MFFIANNPLEQFQLLPLIEIRFGNLDLSFTNSSLLILVGTGLFIFLVKLISHNGGGTLVPNRYQTFFEQRYSFVLARITENVGEKGVKYFPFIFVLFSYLLFCNLLGIIPYSFTVTSHIIITLALSLGVWLGVTVILFRTHGLHAFSLFLPGGAPMVLAPLLVLIEVLSYFIRVVSLSVRLFANIMSGHILLKVLLGFAWTIMSSGGLIIIAHLFPIIVVFLLLFLETGIAIIQAYVFATLSCIYLNDAINLH